MIDGFLVSEDMLPQIDDLPEDMRTIAEVVGVQKTIELSDRFQGTTLYFPRLLSLRRKVRNSAIRSDYDNGLKPARLAAKYNLTERHIWTILGTAE